MSIVCVGLPTKAVDTYTRTVQIETHSSVLGNQLWHFKGLGQGLAAPVFGLLVHGNQSRQEDDREVVRGRVLVKDAGNHVASCVGKTDVQYDQVWYLRFS